MKILQVSTLDLAGGAEKIALGLHRSYLTRGHDSWLAVGTRRGSGPQILELDNSPYEGPWRRTLDTVRGALAPRARNSRLYRAGLVGATIAARPSTYRRYRQGREIFDFPSTAHILELPGGSPNVIHAHNLHGNYFDLTQLPDLSRLVPTFLTLHDAWLLSGHCAHSFGCNRWRTGCGNCPDLTIYPAIRKDATRLNWQEKKGIFEQSNLFVASPARWLLNAVEESILQPAVREARHIPLGIDLSYFRPGDRIEARGQVGLPLDRPVLLVVGNGIKSNMWRDYPLLLNALGELGRKGYEIEVIALGEGGEHENFQGVRLTFVSHSAEAPMAAYYRAADIYLHPARADTFPTAVLEAIACGIPVVATNVGGLPEQIRSLDVASLTHTSTRIGMATGVLVDTAMEMTHAVETLLKSETLRKRLGRNGAADAKVRFDHERMVEDYLDWYAEVLAKIQNREPAA